MQRHGKGGQPAKSRRDTTVTLKARKQRLAASVLTDQSPNQFDRLKRERDEALEQQAATSEVLKVISRSASDLSAALDTLLATACRLCEADIGSIRFEEGDHYRLAATFGCPPEWRKHFAGYTSKPDLTSVFGQTIIRGRTVHIPDVLLDADYARPEAQKLMNLRAALGVPLVREGRVFGAVNLFRTRPRPFTPKQIALVETFTDQAVIAIENVRLFDEVQARTRELSESLEQQTATSEVLRVISSSPGELQPVFLAILENAVQICQARFGMLSLFDGNQIRHAASYNVPSAFKELRQRDPVVPIEGTVVGRVVKSKDVINLADVAAEEEHSDTALVKIAGARSVIGVPMLKEEQVIGAIVIYRTEIGPFSNKQVKLLTDFSAQAVIAIENTRLLNELRQRTDDLTESLEQQTATSEVLKVISSSPGELKPVFDAMLENATRICNAQFGFFWLAEGDGFHAVATHGVPSVLVEERRKQGVIQFPVDTPLGRMRITKQSIHVPDIRDEPSYLRGFKPIVSLADLGGARTLLMVPMLKDNELIGGLAIYRREVKSFTDKQIELVGNFAAQAVIAIENTRLLNELRERTDDLTVSLEQQTATSEVLKVISSSPGELEPIFKTMIENATRLCGAETGTFALCDGNGFRGTAVWGHSKQYAVTVSHIRPIPGTGLALIEETHQTVQFADVASEAAYDEIRRHNPDYARIRTALYVPIVKESALIGAFLIYRHEVRPFTGKHIELVQNFASQAVIAIENARLLNELRQRTDDLTRSLDELQTAQDRLVQTEKLASLGQLTAGIAHEIKNPLNFVNNFSGVSVELIDELQETLRNIKADDKTLTEISEVTNTLRGNLDKVVQHGKRADSIVKNMLLHSRQGSAEHRPVDINALVEESLNLAWHGARAEKQDFNITLERSLDPAAGEVDVFPQEITRVLLNLISNGFYAATKRNAEAVGGYEPTLAAATTNLGDRVEIRIRDNGTGIPAEVKEKMFNPFFTTKPAGEGTGLGLSISHDIIVKQHAGSIEVDSQPGEFTEIRIILPRIAASLTDLKGVA